MLWFSAHSYHTNSSIKTFHSAHSLCSALHSQSSRPTAFLHTGPCTHESRRCWRLGPLQNSHSCQAWPLCLISPVFWGKWMSQCGWGPALTWCCEAGRHRRVMWSRNAPVRLLCLIHFRAVFNKGWNSHFSFFPPFTNSCVTLFTADEVAELRKSFRLCHRASSSPYRLPYRSQLQLASSLSSYVILMRKLPTPH